MANNKISHKTEKKTLMIIPQYVSHTTEKRISVSQGEGDSS